MRRKPAAGSAGIGGAQQDFLEEELRSLNSDLA